MKTNILSGYFDVTIYNERQTKDQRQLKSETDNITFTTSYTAAALPEYFAGGLADNINSVKAYKDREGNDRYAVTFKISPRTAWFDKDGKQCAKPTNEELNGNKYECVVVYREVVGTGKSAHGYWVRAIQFKQADAFEFAPMTGTSTSTADEHCEPNEEKAVQMVDEVRAQEMVDEANELPF